MKRRVFVGAAILIIGALTLAVLLGRRLIAPFGGRDHPTAVRSPVAKPQTLPTPAPIPPQRPQLFKSTRYPPETAAEKVMWEWWQAMEKGDPKFEWKMPIEFYGRAIDQFGAPVDAATVNLEWTVVGGTTKQVIETTNDGAFSLRGARGKLLGVNIVKVGYLYTLDSIKSFEYAAFFQENFHVPDPAKPVTFRLQKLLGSEPYYEYPIHGKFPANGEPVRLNIASGKLGDVGELAVRVKVEGNTERGPTYTVTVEAQRGVGILATTEEFPFLAPEAGYQEGLTVRQDPLSTKYERSTVLKLFIKFSANQYAYVGVTAQCWGEDRSAVLSGGVRYTEKWGRNLEFDHRKKINR